MSDCQIHHQKIGSHFEFQMRNVCARVSFTSCIGELKRSNKKNQQHEKFNSNSMVQIQRRVQLCKYHSCSVIYEFLQFFLSISSIPSAFGGSSLAYACTELSEKSNSIVGRWLDDVMKSWKKLFSNCKCNMCVSALEGLSRVRVYNPNYDVNSLKVRKVSSLNTKTSRKKFHV